jgi:hypothetical protein
MIRVLTSVGTMVVIFDHELRAVIDAFKGVYAELRNLVEMVSRKQREPYEGVLERLKHWTVSVEEQGKQIGLLLSASSPGARADPCQSVPIFRALRETL